MTLPFSQQRTWADAKKITVYTKLKSTSIRRVLSFFRDSLGTILAIRLFVCQFDKLVGGGEHGLLSSNSCWSRRSEHSYQKLCKCHTKVKLSVFLFGKTNRFFHNEKSINDDGIDQEEQYVFPPFLTRPPNLIFRAKLVENVNTSKKRLVLTDTLRSGNRHYRPIFQAPGYVWAHKDRWRCGW